MSNCAFIRVKPTVRIQIAALTSIRIERTTTSYSIVFCVLQCVVGWAGNGKVCGPDLDLDRWPDIDLPCNDTRCKKVSKARTRD